MRRTALWLLCFGSVAISATMAGAAEPPDVRRVLAAWADTWRTGDVDRMMAFYDDSRMTVLIESRGVMHRGAAAIRLYYRNALTQMIWEKVELEELEIDRHGDAAWAVFRFKAEGQAKEPAMPLAFDFRGTIVLKWDGRAWRIVQEHLSPIADVPRVRTRQQ